MRPPVCTCIQQIGRLLVNLAIQREVRSNTTIDALMRGRCQAGALKFAPWSSQHPSVLRIQRLFSMPRTPTGRFVLFGFFGLLAFPHLSVIGIAVSSAKCRCIFGDACWPSESEFSKLGEQVSQPLLHPLPPASPCYPLSRPSGDCVTAQRLWTDPSWRANQSGAMQEANFETFVFQNDTTSACFINTTLAIPCGQGSVPVVGVDARNDADVQAAVNFAAAHNLRVVVKGNG